MNRSYRLIRNAAGATVAAPETARGRGKGRHPAFAFALLFVAGAAHALPEGGQVNAGSGAIGQSGATMTVNQSSQRLALDWQSFNVGAGETMNFVQPGASAIALNRVLGTEGSQILGRLNANGQVFLLNPNGVLFGPGAQVNVGGLVASTLNLSDADFLAGRYSFSGNGGAVVNQGTLTATEGGTIALLGGRVSNEGVISARLGTVALAAGSKITLDFAGDRLLNAQVDEGALDALVQNRQLIRAEGGTVLMTAKGADALLRTVVNNEGVIEARTLENRGGVIKLLGGMEGGVVQVGGTLDASAPDGGDGGFIDTSGHRVNIGDDARITTAAPSGKSGVWLIDPNDFTIAANGGNLTGARLSSNLQTSNVTISTATQGTPGGNGDIFVNDAVTWGADTTLTLDAARSVRVNAAVTANGTHAGLAVLTGNGGDFLANAPIILRGSGATLNIDNQSYTLIRDAAALRELNLAGRSALADDIALSGNATPLGTLSGTFEGLGHTVSGLTLANYGWDYQGLFGQIGSSGTVRNLTMADGNVSGNNYVGLLAGDNQGTIVNVAVSGAIAGLSYVGGLVGYNGGSVSNARSSGNATGNGSGIMDKTGGLAGYNAGTISFSYATANVGGDREVGGLVGYNVGTVSSSYAAGTVDGFFSYVGGLVGQNDHGIISSSYATGAVNGYSYVGGLVGQNDNGTISSSYATGAVSSDSLFPYVGGLVGDTIGGAILSSYAAGAVRNLMRTPAELIGGLAGRNAGTVGSSNFWDKDSSKQTKGIGFGQDLDLSVTGLTSAEVMRTSSYAGFDFTNTWYMVDGYTRPFLRSEYSTAIGNAHQLQLMGMNPGASYVLIADIAMPGPTAAGMWNAASGFAAIGSPAAPFTGTLDGAGHVISGLTIANPSADHQGLFGVIGTSGTVRNLGLVGGNVSGKNYVGLLAGDNQGTIVSVAVDGTVSGNSKIGGLAGINKGTVSNAYSTGAVTGNNDVGGLVGENAGALSDVHSTGRVGASPSVRASGSFGGLVAYNTSSGTIARAHAAGTVSGSPEYLGGLVGYNDGAITTGYTTGIVGDARYVGGLVGYNNGTVSSTYAAVSGNWFTSSWGGMTMKDGYGGLVGHNNGKVTASFWYKGPVDYYLFHSITIAGVGGNNGSFSATGLTAAEGKRESSYVGWDFVDTWRIDEGRSYPQLRTQAFGSFVPPSDSDMLPGGGSTPDAASGVTIEAYIGAVVDAQRTANSQAAARRPAASAASTAIANAFPLLDILDGGMRLPDGVSINEERP